MLRRSPSQRRVIVTSLVAGAVLVAGCSESDEPASESETTVTENSPSTNDSTTPRPAGAGTDLVASPGLPARALGVTIIVDDAQPGGAVAFSAATGSGADAPIDEWAAVAAGERVEFEGFVIEVAEIESSESVVFTLWRS